MFFEVRFLVSALMDSEPPALLLWSWLRAHGNQPRVSTMHVAGRGLHPDKPPFRVSDRWVDYRLASSLAIKAATLGLHERAPDVTGDGDPLARWRMTVECTIQLDDQSFHHRWLGAHFRGPDGAALNAFLGDLLSVIDVQDNHLRSLLTAVDTQHQDHMTISDESAG